MKTGIQYVEGLSVKRALESGFTNIELCMEDIDKLDDIKALGGRIAGININLNSMLASETGDKADREVLSEDAVEIFGKAISYAAVNICSYIVINTEGVSSKAVLEQLVSESLGLLKECSDCKEQVSIYVENGYRCEYGRYYHNGFSDWRELMSLINNLEALCPYINWKICINVGHTNLLGINIRDMVRVCGKHIGLVHINDNNGLSDQHQMPYTFTTGRGVLSTDWPRFIGELHTAKFDGYIIFDNKGTFARTPQKLHKVMLELMKACVDEWEENCFNAEEYIGQKDKKLILFGSGRMAQTYMDYWGERYTPAFVVDNNSQRWGQQFMGVEIKSPEAILDIPAEQRNVWICNLNYDIIGNQLERMGIEYRCYRDLYFI